MASSLKNLSEINGLEKNAAENLNFGIVVAEWHNDITEHLYQGAVETLKMFSAKNIYRLNVPGSFELTYGAKKFIFSQKVDAVIVVGCIIQGETRHFDFVAESVTQGITELNLQYNIPTIFCVLTTQNLQQAKDRAGGKHGNKGVEAAVAAIKMALLNKNFYDLIKKEKMS